MLICDISYKTLIGPKPLRSGSDKIDGLLEFMMKLNIYNTH